MVVKNLRVGMSRGRVAHALDAVRVRVRGARERRRNIRVENQKNMEQKEGAGCTSEAVRVLWCKVWVDVGWG